MILTVLGSGTCVPSLRRGAPAYLLEAEGFQALVDCGSGSLLQLERLKKSYRDLDAVFLTHHHPDHLSDLIPLIQALKYTPGFIRRKDLFVIGPPSVRQMLDRCVHPAFLAGEEHRVRVLDPREVSLPVPFAVRVFETGHTDDGLAFRFESGGRVIVLTGDTDLSPGLAAFCADADLLVIDCSFPAAEKVEGHLSARECGMVAREARARRVLLSHFYPSSKPDEVRRDECRENFSGDVLVAEDRLEIPL